MSSPNGETAEEGGGKVTGQHNTELFISGSSWHPQIWGPQWSSEASWIQPKAASGHIWKVFCGMRFQKASQKWLEIPGTNWKWLLVTSGRLSEKARMPHMTFWGPGAAPSRLLQCCVWPPMADSARNHEMQALANQSNCQAWKSFPGFSPVSDQIHSKSYRTRGATLYSLTMQLLKSRRPQEMVCLYHHAST